MPIYIVTIRPDGDPVAITNQIVTAFNDQVRVEVLPTLSMLILHFSIPITLGDVRSDLAAIEPIVAIHADEVGGIELIKDLPAPLDVADEI